MTQPKILLYDIENAPSKGYYWGPEYDTSICWPTDDWYMLSFAYTWFDPDGLDPDNIHFERKAVRKGDDKGLTKKIWKLYGEADAVMAHNGDRFDQKKVWTRAAKHQLYPVRPYFEIDTLKLAKSKFAFPSNKLDRLARFFDVGQKLPTQGMHTWIGCMENDPESWATMEAYNRHDIVLMDGVFRHIEPYIKTKLNFGAFTDAAFVCPHCGSMDLQGRGPRPVSGSDNKRQQFQCNECLKYSSDLMSNRGRLRA